MSFNGSGLFQINTSGQPVVTGTAIDPAVFNALTADLATGLTTCITKDGQTTPTANIPLGSNKITGLAAATARTDATNLGNIQDCTGVYVGTVGGTADVITLTPSPAITSYTAGQTFRFIASGANTTNVTVNVNALGAKAITKNGTTALAAGDIPSGMMVEITYDGTRFILESAATSTINSPTITSPTISSGAVTLTSGQIAFPATQAASADANTLDDYEEGTWTPSVGGTATYTTQSGRYTKIGNVVTATFILVINAIGTGSTSVIATLPFQNGSVHAIGNIYYETSAVSLVELVAHLANGGTAITLKGATGAGGSLSTQAVMQNGTTIIGTITYLV